MIESNVLAAIIGVGGVMVGVAMSEILQWIRRRQSRRERELALRGCLIGLYYEMRHNLGLASNLKKLEIRTYDHDPNIVRTAMLGDVRTYYADLNPTLIDAIEAAYADLQELVHLVDTGTSGEHKKWTARGTEVHTSTKDGMRQLREKVSKLGVELPALPNKPLEPTAGRN